jgi:hypothetical protein
MQDALDHGIRLFNERVFLACLDQIQRSRRCRRFPGSTC